MIDSVLKTNPWTYKIKDLNEEKIYIEILLLKDILLLLIILNLKGKYVKQK